MEVLEAHPFRVIRDADIEIQEIEADDLLETMQQSIRRRKFGSVVQIAIHDSMPIPIRNLLVENLEIKRSDVFIQKIPLGLADLMQVYESIERYDLKYPPYQPRVVGPFKDVEVAEDIFATIRQENILLHHPYDSFSSVIDFLNASARDPQVLAINKLFTASTQFTGSRGIAGSLGTRQASGRARGTQGPLR